MTRTRGGGSMPPEVRAVFDDEMRRARRSKGSDERWSALERAHILSQPWSWPHVQVHASMLRLAVTERDVSEATGQMVRIIVAAPGSAAGRYPLGNTGRAAVGLMQPMPVPDDLARVLPREAGP